MTGMLESSNDIVLIGGPKFMEMSIYIPISIYHENKKGWPDIQALPDRSAICAENLEIEMEWWRKYDIAPPMADMHQDVPSPYCKAMPSVVEVFKVFHPSTNLKDLEKDIVWKHIDHYRILVMLACATKSQNLLQLPPWPRGRTQLEGACLWRIYSFASHGDLEQCSK